MGDNWYSDGVIEMNQRVLSRELVTGLITHLGKWIMLFTVP